MWRFLASAVAVGTTMAGFVSSCTAAIAARPRGVASLSAQAPGPREPERGLPSLACRQARLVATRYETWYAEGQLDRLVDVATTRYSDYDCVVVRRGDMLSFHGTRTGETLAQFKLPSSEVALQTLSATGPAVAAILPTRVEFFGLSGSFGRVPIAGALQAIGWSPRDPVVAIVSDLPALVLHRFANDPAATTVIALPHGEDMATQGRPDAISYSADGTLVLVDREPLTALVDGAAARIVWYTSGPRLVASQLSPDGRAGVEQVAGAIEEGLDEAREVRSQGALSLVAILAPRTLRVHGLRGGQAGGANCVSGVAPLAAGDYGMGCQMGGEPAACRPLSAASGCSVLGQCAAVCVRPGSYTHVRGPSCGRANAQQNRVPREQAIIRCSSA